jgi:HEAT repeat protein
MALVDGERPERLDVLRDALRHTDGRVRANAVEAMATICRRGDGRLDPARATPWLERLAEQEENRLRGNAVLALLRMRRASGGEHLRAMLRDTRPLHRVSAIWAARTSRMQGAAGELLDLQGGDELPEIRTRAATALRWLGATGEPARAGA